MFVALGYESIYGNLFAEAKEYVKLWRCDIENYLNIEIDLLYFLEFVGGVTSLHNNRYKMFAHHFLPNKNKPMFTDWVLNKRTRRQRNVFEII